VPLLKLSYHGRAYDVIVVDAATVQIDGQDFTVARAHAGAVRVGGRTAWVARDRDTRWVYLDGRCYEIHEPRRGAPRRAAGHHGALTSPMPATVRRIAVAVGDTVKAGDALIVLEAMKMELPVRATHAGTVAAITCREGELVQPGVPLIELDES
jgi:biotin carboxyl carrier protein